MQKLLKVSDEQAQEFMRRNHANSEHIAISSADDWLAAVDNNGEIIGVVGMLRFKKSLRIKGFFVAPGWRSKGIGKLLLENFLIPGAKVSVFATSESRPLFEAQGFKVVKMGKNDIAFMERSADYEKPSL